MYLQQQFTGQAHAAIPDDATPNDIKAAISSLETLGKSKVDIYSKPGTGGTTGGNTGGGTISIGNSNYYQDANGNWKYK
jgi:hypothetical protein